MAKICHGGVAVDVPVGYVSVSFSALTNFALGQRGEGFELVTAGAPTGM